LYSQPPSESETLREVVGLTETEIGIVTSPRLMRTGQALWRLADRSFLVQTVLAPEEAELARTRDTMVPSAPGRPRVGSV
jgi:hypothetical protein